MSGMETDKSGDGGIPRFNWRRWGFPRHEHFFPIVIANPIHIISNSLNSTNRYPLYYLHFLKSAYIQQIQLDELQITSGLTVFSPDQQQARDLGNAGHRQSVSTAQLSPTVSVPDVPVAHNGRMA